MKTGIVMGAALSAAAVGGLAVVVACSSSSAVPVPQTSAPTQCSTKAGQFPVANCVPYDPTTESCQSPPLSCDTSPCDMSSPCLAMVPKADDNSGKTVANFRMRKLNITAPDALAFQPPSHVFVQKAVIDQGIYLHNFCGEGPHDGTFSWLIQLDTVNNKVKTGGAPPTMDPFGTGYCFVNTTIQNLQVAPITVDVTKGSDGSYATAKIPKLFVPIYSPSTSGGFQTIILPLSGAQVKDITLSDSNNCIGGYNAKAINSVTSGSCTDDPTACSRWTTAGSLGGYITLNDSDGVAVPQLSESLCVLLTGGSSVVMNGSFKSCMKDGSGNVMAKGDYCSTTDSPGGCQDSYWLAATFAASAAKIVDPNQPDCMGGTMSGGDGGTEGGATEAGTGDSGSPTDAGGQ